MKVRFDYKQKNGGSVHTFYFKPPKLLRYTAGQFIEMHLPHDNEDDRGHKRWFTLSSAPEEKLISITTKLDKKGSSFKKALASLKPGQEISIVEPMGDFVLPRDEKAKLCFVAGGMGITPYLSILRWLNKTKQERDIQLILAVTNESDYVFEDEFKKSITDVVKIVSKPGNSWHGQTGRLSVERIEEFADGLDGKTLFVSGPEPMVENLEKQLLDKGLQRNKVICDFFPGYPVV